MLKTWKMLTAATMMLTLAACGGSAPPGNDGTPPGSGLDPESCRVVLTEPVRTDLHLESRGSGCDYRIAGNNIQNLMIRATLTADPGTVVMVEPGVRIVIDDGASLDLRGTADRPISFIGMVPERGSWDGFCFTGDNQESWFDYVHVVWAGNNAWGISAPHCRGAIGSHSTAEPVNISNSIIFGSKTTGIEAFRMVLGDFRNNRLSNNAEYGIRVAGGNVSRLDSSTDYAGRKSVFGNGLVTPNGMERVYVRPGVDRVYTTGRIHEWKNLGVPYHIAADTSAGVIQTSFQFNAQTHTVIEAGTELLIGETVSLSIEEDAIVVMAGTQDDKVVIMGDAPVAGHWDGIDIDNGALISNHAEVHHAGRQVGIDPYMGSIAFGGLGPVYDCSYVANTLIADSGSNGIVIGSAYEEYVHIGDDVRFERIAGDEIVGTDAGPAVTTIEEALNCLH